MASLKRWNEKYEKEYCHMLFTPRICKDLLESEWVKNIPSKLISESIFIYGKTGKGKTILACKLLLDLIKKDYFSHSIGTYNFISIPVLMQQLKEGFQNNIGDKILSNLNIVDILVLDEFGFTKPSDWALQILYLLINHRYEQGKQTIITSNNDLDTVAKIFGDDRITSRIERSYHLIHKSKLY